MNSQGKKPDEKAAWLCKYDIACHEKPLILPSFAQVAGEQDIREAVLEFYRNKANLQKYLPGYIHREPKQIVKMAHFEIFPFHPETGEKGRWPIVFDYMRRDPTGRALAQLVENFIMEE